MTDSSDNKRRFQRIAFKAKTSLSQANLTQEVNLLDLSLKGLLVDAPAELALAPEKAIQACIRLEGDAVITMEVSLSHRQGTQLGFKCEMIDVDSISHLRRLIALNTGDAKAAERELSELAADS